VPEALARHNQEDLEISYGLGNFPTNSNTPAISSENSFGNLTPDLFEEMAEQNMAIGAVRQMPSYRHHTAPKFTEDQPRELKRFFEELANLFGPANIIADSEKKSQTVRYVEVDTADMWRSLPEFSNEESSYEDWKKKVISLYPGASEEKRWSIADLDKVIGERARIGIHTIGDFGAYYRAFYTISAFLAQKNRLSPAEQSRLFIKGLSEELWHKIFTRMSIRDPDHDPDDYWPLEDVRKAGEYVLNGTNPPILPNGGIAIGHASNAAGTNQNGEALGKTVKQEDLAGILEKFTQQIVNVLSAKNTSSGPSNYQPASNFPSRGFSGGFADGKRACHFCGSEFHLLSNCDKVDKCLKEGKCIRNAEGRLVLPGGGYIPRHINGKNMWERFEEWHIQNPGQLAKGILSSSTIEGLMYDCVPGTRVTESGSTYVGTLRMTPGDEEIYRLERQLNALKKKQIFDGVEIPYSNAHKPKEIPKGPITKAVPKTPKEAEPMQDRQGKGQSTETIRPIAEGPVHPYANIPEARYAPPVTKNFGAPMDKPTRERDMPAYRTVAPIAEKSLVEEVYKRAVYDTKVVLTVEELLNISPDFREKFRRESTPRRVSIKEMEKNIGATVRLHKFEENPFRGEGRIEEVFESTETSKEMGFSKEEREISKDEQISLGGNANSEAGDSSQDMEGYVVPDHYEAYLRTLKPGQERMELTVAKESHSLRTLMLEVDQRLEVEAIIDPGCQIVAISEDICHRQGLIYDPTIQLNMQSANGEVDRSLGLARNVPCCIGPITLFLQMHVIREAAYDILLGRPFDVLTESVVRNYDDENQTITIRDPNSGKIVTIPTLPKLRRRHPGYPGSSINFQVLSRN
jgi:hypothetical protein